MNEKDKRIVISIISIVAVIALVAGSVYAYFSFATNSGNVATTNGKLDIDYNISEPNLTGVLIPSSTRSGGVLEVATAKLNAGSIDAAINFYITPTSISGFPLSALCYDVDVLNTSNEVIDTYTGTFEDATLNSPLKIIDGYNLTTNLLTFNIYIWLDGSKINNENFNGNNSFSAMITADSVPVTGYFEPQPNPITDYEYEIGTEDAEGYVILKKYIGTSSTVVVPNTYKINDVTYNTALFLHTDPTGTITPSTFDNNTIIASVTLPSNYKVYHYSKYNPDTGIINTKMVRFHGCTSLVDAPTIPNSVTDMSGTFYGCTSLINAPVIPSSVTNMYSTFSGCTSLVNAPVIPNSVEYMYETFYGCTSLVTAPTIPNSVTNMNSTFSGCTNLTGTVRVNSSNVSLTGGGGVNMFNPFYETVNPITVEVPVGSQTYNHFTASGKPANVTVTTFTPE